MANSFCFRVFASCAVESSLTHRTRDELHRHGCDRIDMIAIHRRCFIESVGLADLRIAATTHRRFQAASPWPDFEPPSPASSRKADNEARWNRKGVRRANRCSTGSRTSGGMAPSPIAHARQSAGCSAAAPTSVCRQSVRAAGVVLSESQAAKVHSHKLMCDSLRFFVGFRLN